MIEKRNSNVRTAEQLLAMPEVGLRYELIGGELYVRSPAGSEHGWIAGRILTRLSVHVEKFNLGRTFAAETGFLISKDPDTVRAPDAAFVSRERLQSVEPTIGYLPLAPDLVVEVISSGDSYSEVEAKASQWLEAGTRVVLLADPANRTLTVQGDSAEFRVLRSGETFDSGDVCGGWKLSVDEAFEIKG